MSGTPPSNRPLSPHLTIYRLQITSVMSILHRLTGIGLAVTAALVVWWLVAAATGDRHFAFVDGILASWFGRLVLALSLWAFWYHFCNGIRHLSWDAGRGFDLPTVTRSGVAAVIVSLALTIATLAFGWLN